MPSTRPALVRAPRLPPSIPSLGARRPLRTHCDLCTGRRPRLAVARYGPLRLCELHSWYLFHREVTLHLSAALRAQVAATGERRVEALLDADAVQPWAQAVGSPQLAVLLAKVELARIAGEAAG